MKFSALNVDFSSLGFNLLRLMMRPAHVGVKYGYSFKSGDFCAICLFSVITLAYCQIGTDVLLIITSTDNMLFSAFIISNFE